MKKIYIKWRYLLLIFLSLVFGVYRLIGYQEEQRVGQAIMVVKQLLKLSPQDKLTGCLAKDKNYTLVQINRDLLLAYDGQKVIIPEQGINQTKRVKELAPELPVLSINYDPYEVAENCYLQ